MSATVFRGAVSCSTITNALGTEGVLLDAADQRALGDGTMTVGQFSGLPGGTYTLRVQGRRPGEGTPDSGPVLIERCVVTSLTNDRVVRVALTTDCINVTCPAPGGSAAFGQCLNGRCVDPSCDLDDPSTVEACCDRALLGEACTSVPTLCRTASDCEPAPSCSGPRTCERGACVEPSEDSCPPGLYCDASADACLPTDGRPVDGGVGDAPPVPDAPPDAAPPPPEDCTLEGDEDGNGDADCADSACAGTSICVSGCAPLRDFTPPMPPTIPRPAHWYRADVGAVVSGSSVCALRDLVGDAHLVAPVGVSLATLAALAGQPALAFSGDARLTTSSDLAVGPGNYVVTIVSTGGEGAYTLFRTFAVGTMRPFVTLRAEAGSGATLRVLEMDGSTFTSSMFARDSTAIEAVFAQTAIEGSALAMRYYRTLVTAETLTLREGSGLAGPPLTEEQRMDLGPCAGGASIAEVLVHDHILTGDEALPIRTYLEGRYP